VNQCTGAGDHLRGRDVAGGAYGERQDGIGCRNRLKPNSSRSALCNPKYALETPAASQSSSQTSHIVPPHFASLSGSHALNLISPIQPHHHPVECRQSVGGNSDY
jgi:hypothetical protein